MKTRSQHYADLRKTLPASQAWRYAKHAMEAEATVARFYELGGEIRENYREPELELAKVDGPVALLVIPDDGCDLSDLEGDMFNPKACPGIPRKRLEAEQKAFRERVEREGVWGVQAWFRNAAGEWEQGDSCWAFVGDDWKEGQSDFMGDAIRRWEREQETVARVEAFAAEIA